MSRCSCFYFQNKNSTDHFRADIKLFTGYFRTLSDLSIKYWRTCYSRRGVVVTMSSVKTKPSNHARSLLIDSVLWQMAVFRNECSCHIYFWTGLEFIAVQNTAVICYHINLYYKTRLISLALILLWSQKLAVCKFT